MVFLNIKNNIFFYFISKVFKQLSFYFLNQNTGYIFNKSLINEKFNNVIFDFSNTNHFHIGDILYFIPSIIWLQKNKIKIHIIHSNLSKSIIDLLNIKVNHKLNKKNCLYISTLDCMTNNREYNNYLFFNTSDYRIKNNIGIFITEIISKKIQICVPLDNFNFWPKLKNDTIFPFKNYIIFSDEVISGSFRLNNNYKKKLFESICNSVNNNYLIIRVGMFKSTLKYSNNFIDLGSKTSISELIYLINSKECKEVYSFDSGIAHLGIIFGKKTNIMFKKRLNSNYLNYLKSNIFPITKSHSKIIFLN